jgi:Zn-dependent M28 family amino/carboxypeptidase
MLSFSGINEITTANSVSLEFDENNAFEHISTQLDFGFRVPGTLAHNNCAEWIKDEIQTHVDEMMVQEYNIQFGSQPSYYCQNILGKINTQKKNIVILGAHWDSRNVAEKDTYNQSQPIPGANDGGSGVGALLELARVFSLYRENLDCQLWFLFIDAEDQGYSLGMYGLEYWDWCEGSRYFTADIENFYNSNSENIESFILLDMVGGTDLQFIKESNSNQNLHNRIFREGQKLGYSDAFPSNPTIMSIIDDHIAFRDIGITVIDLIIDFVNGAWEYHHTHFDNLDNVDPESLKITGQTIESFLKSYYSDKFPIWGYFVIILSSGVIIAIPVVFSFRKRK